MSPNERQRVVRVPGARRAKLTPAPGTDLEHPEADEAPAETTGAFRDAVAPVPMTDEARADEAGPNDERMRREVPPHY
jgi:hypothetical protein